MCDKKVFISYSRADKNVVEAIVRRIESELYNDCCWIDVDGIESGQMFWDVIINAVKKCNAFLLMASDRSMSSDNVLGEIQIAKNNSKNIVPVIIDKSVLKNDRFLAHFPINNYILSDNPDHMSRLIHDLKNWCYIDTSLTKRTDVAVNNSPADVCLKVLSNLDCKVFIDGEEKGMASANCLTKIPLPIGEYYAEFVSTENPAHALSREIILEHDKLEKVDLLSLKQAREESERAERERLARIESMTLVPYISNNKVGFADLETREIIIPCRYDFVSLFSEGLASIKMNNKWGFIDKYGTQVVQFKYDDYFSSTDYFKYFHDGLAVVRLNGLYGCVNKYGRQVVPCIYGGCSGVSEGIACVRLETWNRGKWGYVDKFGREITPFIYDFACDFHEGLARVESNGRWGFVDKSGCVVIPCKYESGDIVIGLTDSCIDCDFHEGLARVKSNGKYGFIDKSGKEIIPCKYDVCSNFCGGLTSVTLNGKKGYIDRFGNEMWSEE